MKILQNNQPATIYIQGVKYEFVDGVCEKENNEEHAEILREYNYIVELDENAPAENETPADEVQEEPQLDENAPAETNKIAVKNKKAGK